MSEKLLKTRKYENNLRAYQSDPELYRDAVDFGSFVRLVKLSRGKAMDLMNKTDPELGVSLIADDSVLDVSRCANQIVVNALKIPRCLYCPFCAADFMFEFTLKEHLKKRHGREIGEMAACNQTVTDVYEVQTCPYCSAVFYYFALLPIHILQQHDATALQQWQKVTGNMQALHERNQNCRSIELLSASSGMSEMLRSLDISGGKSLDPETPKLKSILKKRSNFTDKIIFSPSTGSLRRMASEVTKRNNTPVRRELRFDLPPEEFEYTVADPMCFLRESPTPEKVGCFGRSCKKQPPKKSVEQQTRGWSPQELISSTPKRYTFMPSNHETATPKPSIWRRLFPKKIKVPKLDPESSSFIPSCFKSSRFQCRHCALKYETNAELRAHLSRHHSFLRKVMASNKCGECKKTFYSNPALVRHTILHLSPQK